MDNSEFDILDYLNQVYMHRMAPSIDVAHAGGHHNIHDNGNNAEEEITEKNKKRIYIPNAKIKHFQVRWEQDIEEHNEPEDAGSGGEQSGEDGTGYNEVSDERTQKGSIGGGYSQDVIQISDKNPTRKLLALQKDPSQDIII